MNQSPDCAKEDKQVCLLPVCHRYRNERHDTHKLGNTQRNTWPSMWQRALERDVRGRTEEQTNSQNRLLPTNPLSSLLLALERTRSLSLDALLELESLLQLLFESVTCCRKRNSK